MAIWILEGMDMRIEEARRNAAIALLRKRVWECARVIHCEFPDRGLDSKNLDDLCEVAGMMGYAFGYLDSLRLFDTTARDITWQGIEMRTVAE
jgi:hypothetical protein